MKGVAGGINELIAVLQFGSLFSPLMDIKNSDTLMGVAGHCALYII